MRLCNFVGQIPISKKNKKKGYKEELEERLVSIIASLLGKKASELQIVVRLHVFGT